MSLGPRDVIHLLGQVGQPYGSVRRCCERCGIMITEGMMVVFSALEFYGMAAGLTCVSPTAEPVSPSSPKPTPTRVGGPGLMRKPSRNKS